jgi:hypothetical protein
MPTHWNNSQRVDMLLHSDTLSLSLDDKSFLLLFKAEKQQIPIS